MRSRARFFRMLHTKLPLVCAVALGSLYTAAAYYMYIVVKKPRVECRDKRLMELIEKHCPVAKEYYYPTWWCFESHGQTLLRSFIQSKPRICYRTEMLLMPDGGRVKLDWADGSGLSPAFTDATRPTVLLLPGLTGCSYDNYVLHMVNLITELGYRCVVFNNRGCGGTDLWTSRTYCAANTEDLEYVVNYVKKTLPASPVMGIGVSLGGVILFNYLARMGKDTGLVAGMCISVMWDLVETATSLEKPLNILFYNKYLTHLLITKMESQSHIFSDFKDMENVLQSTTMREFDDRFTAKQFGYSSSEHYYEDASIYKKIHLLRVPVLTLNSADDPFSPVQSIPVEEAHQNDLIAMVITDRGGHIGFMEGIFPRGRTYMHRWVSQFVDAIFKHGIKVD